MIVARFFSLTEPGSQVDHVVPISRGGSQTDESNLTLACSQCNADKGTDIWKFGCKVGWYCG